MNTRRTVSKEHKAWNLCFGGTPKNSKGPQNIVKHVSADITETETDRFREYVRKLKPFNTSDRKAVKFTDKSIPRSLYSNLTNELIEGFFTMKIKNMK